MRIGILGSGLMGSKLGTLFARAGHDVVFSYSRNKEKLDRLASEASGNARAGPPDQAAQNAEALLIAVHWSHVDDVLKQAGDLSGKLIVTCSLPMDDDDNDLVIGHSMSGAETLARKVPAARIVCAFNTAPSEVLFGVFQARHKQPRPNLVYCGDDAHSKSVAAGLIRDVGFDPVDAPDRCGSPVTWSPARCLWRSSPMNEVRVPNWPTGSSALRNRRSLRILWRSEKARISTAISYLLAGARATLTRRKNRFG